MENEKQPAQAMVLIVYKIRDNTKTWTHTYPHRSIADRDIGNAFERGFFLFHESSSFERYVPVHCIIEIQVIEAAP